MAISVPSDVETTMLKSRMAHRALAALVTKSGKPASDPLWQALQQLAELAKQHHNAIRMLIDANSAGGAGAMI